MKCNIPFEIVTPEMAKHYLSYNWDNRRFRPWWANSIAGIIKRGEWIATHQGIAFDTAGRLADGQHRLHGIVTSDIPTKIAVYRGVDPDAYKVLDIGIKRTYSETTGLPIKCTEVVRLIATWVYNLKSTISSEQMLNIANAGVAELHEELTAHCSSNAPILSCAPMRAAAVVMMLEGGNKKYIKSIYSNMIHQNYKELPPIGQSLVKQANKRLISPNNKSDLFTRGLKVFNQQKSDVSIIKLSDDDTEKALAFLREIFSSFAIFDELKNQPPIKKQTKPTTMKNWNLAN